MQDCARYVEEMTRLRREIHRRPEEGWTEFETQWKVFRALEALGWTIRMGLDVIRPEAVMGRNAELVEKAMVRAAEHGVPESFLKATGEGLGRPLDSFALHPCGDTLRLDGAALAECTPLAGHVAAVVCETLFPSC